MVWECFDRRIERPCGISGYRPASWCSVCGRSGSQKAVRQCAKEGCPNICHEACLGTAAEFCCGKTGELRAVLGIKDPVTPYSPPAVPSPQTLILPPASEDNTEEVVDDLNDLPKEELAQLVRNLRQDLSSVKRQLNNYRSVTEDLADKRRILVEALSVVDTLLATHASEGTQQKSVACTARPHKIDAEMAPAVQEGTNPLSPPDVPHSHSSSAFSSSPSSSTTSPQPSTFSSSPAEAPTLFSTAPSEPNTPSNIPPQHASHPGLPSLPSPVQPQPNLPPALPPQHTTPSNPPPVSSPPPSLPPHHAPSPYGPPPHSFGAPTQPNPPPTNPPQHTISPVTASAQTTRAWDQEPRSQRANTASDLSGPQRGSQRSWKINKQLSGGRTASGAPACGPRLQPQQDPGHKQLKSKCHLCKRYGHTQDQCTREVCNYCQGLSHSSLTCRARLADQRQQELVQAVRQNGQETLLALRSFAWQLQHPSQTQAARSTLAAPQSLPVPQPPWPVPAYPAHYGAGQYQHTLLRHPGIQ